MRRYQEGGLAAVVTGEDPDERDDPSIVPGALEEVTEVTDFTPADLPTQSRRKQRLDTSRALQRLEDARNRLTDRLAAAEEDRTGEWLALAQGMLAPTKTGGFGESLGMAAGMVREARADRREQLTEIEKSLLDAEVKQQSLALAARPRLGSAETVYHPDDVARYPKDSSKWRQIAMQTIVHSDGETEHIFSGLEDGQILQVVSKSNPITVRDTRTADEIAKEKSRLDAHDISQGLYATLAVPRLRRARELFEKYSTSGLKEDLGNLGAYLNIEIADNATLPLIRNLIGKEILTQLQSLTGTKTDFEYKKIEELNASTRKGREANLKIIDEMLRRYENIIDIGERAAIATAEDVENDLQVGRYRDYRAAEEERRQAAAAAGVVERRAPPTAANDRLIQLFDPDNPTNDQLIEAYKMRYGWPPTDPKVLSELRKKGYKD